MGELIYLGILGAILIWVVFVLLTKRGRQFVFGGKIVHTWDGIKGQRKMLSSLVKVHAVEATSAVRRAGLELSTSTIGSYQIIPISLSASEAL